MSILFYYSYFSKLSNEELDKIIYPKKRQNQKE